MKKVIFLISTLCVFACSEDTNIVMNDSITYVDHVILENHKIDEAKALEYANIYFNQTETRSSAPLKMDYVINEKMTRSGDMADDTVAYIINRGKDDGFVIISSDDRVYPILAHSDKGTFVHEEGSIVDVQFISLIDDYLAENEDNEAFVVTDDVISSCYSKSAVVDSFSYWSQEYPYDMAIMYEHPGCPVGCVALATGIIMSHCKSSLLYHNHTYNFAKLIRSLEKASAPSTRGLVNGDGGNDDNVEVITDTVTYNYFTAIDSISQLLYWTGKDVNTIYTDSGSSASSAKAFDLIKRYNYKIADNSGLISYQNLKAISVMTQGYILYMDGRNNGSTTKGHAWVVDGYHYCIDNISNDTIDAYVHCNWGWAGNWNGYYTGDIFQLGKTNGRIYDGVRYFAVKKEYEQSTGSQRPPILH